MNTGEDMMQLALCGLDLCAALVLKNLGGKGCEPVSGLMKGGESPLQDGASACHECGAGGRGSVVTVLDDGRTDAEDGIVKRGDLADEIVCGSRGSFDRSIGDEVTHGVIDLMTKSGNHREGTACDSGSDMVTIIRHEIQFASPTTD